MVGAILAVVFFFASLGWLYWIALPKNRRYMTPDEFAALARDLRGKEEKMNVMITVGGERYAATLCENKAGVALYSILPLTLEMSELNGNEKYFYTKRHFPSKPSRPAGGIQAGDLMLYGESCIVLFYKSFQTNFSYTPLGRITNAQDIEQAAGEGSVTVTFVKVKQNASASSRKKRRVPRVSG